MRKRWRLNLSNPNIERFISDHELQIRDIRTQPWLGSDINWEQHKDGWEILLYPGLYYDGPAEVSILNALASIIRRTKGLFEETAGPEFDQLTEKFLSERPGLANLQRDDYARIILAFDNALCCSLELKYLLNKGYLDFDDVRSLVNYRSERFVSHRCALEFLATMAVLKAEGGDTSLFYDKIIQNKSYEMFPVLDKIDSCIQSNKVLHADSIDILNLFFPDYQEAGLLEKIDVLRRNVVGPRDENELDFDIAISYAGEDRDIAEAIADCLKGNQLKVFYDKYYEAELWGKDLFGHLTDVYSRRAKFCLLIISKHYALKQWTNTEREAAQSSAFRENAEYVLPLLLDDTQIPGLPLGTAYISIQDHSVLNVCELLTEKVRIFFK